MKKKKNVFNFRFLASIITSWTLLLMFISKSLSIDNMIYAIGEISAYDTNLFAGNVYLAEGVVSPRYIIDGIFKILMHFNGGDWAGAALIWIYFGAVIQALGIANIAYCINSKYQIFISALFTCVIAYCDNFLAGFSLIALSSTSIGVALAFSFLGISFLVGEKRNYKMAWIFAACSSICHIHEGMYCCAIIFLFALIDCIIHKKLLYKENWTMVIAIIALLVVTMPSILTDSMDISNAEFVNIYAKFRTPHHLVPSTWGLDTILKTIWVDVSLFMLSLVALAKSNKNIRQHVYEAIVLGAAWFAAISLQYVFTEIMPLAFIVTMMLSKSFKYALLVALIWIVKALFELRERGSYVSGYLLLFFVFFASSFELIWSCLIAVIIFVIINVEDYFISLDKTFINIKVLPIADMLFLAFMVCAKRAVLGIQNGLIILFVFFAISAIGFAHRKKFKGYQALCVLACFCMIGLSLFGRVISIENGSLSIINGEKAMRASMGDELYELAENFRNQTDVTTEFLGDPDDMIPSGWFQIVSQRNCYVVEKVVPSSKVTMDDWYNRYLQVSPFNDKTAEELEGIMDSSGIEYVLLKADNYSKLDRVDNFSVFMSSPEDSYRVYQLE